MYLNLSKHNLKRIFVVVLITVIFGFVLFGLVRGNAGFEICNQPAPADPVEYERWKTLCQPSQLVDIQALVVRLIYVVWAAAFPLFVLILMFIGFSYMRADDPKNQEDLRMKLMYSIVGFVILLASQPVAAALMKFFLAGSVSSCYANLDTPGFTFFFEDVCTGVRGLECSDDRARFDLDCAGLCGNVPPQSTQEFDEGGKTYILRCICATKTCGSITVKP